MAETLCSFDGCPRRAQGSGLCKSHKWQAQSGKELTPIRPPKICSAVGCERTRHARGFCNTHYAQLKAGKVIQTIGNPEAALCAVPNCVEIVERMGLCSGHDMQRRSRQELTPLG